MRSAVVALAVIGIIIGVAIAATPRMIAVGTGTAKGGIDENTVMGSNDVGTKLNTVMHEATEYNAETNAIEAPTHAGSKQIMSTAESEENKMETAAKTVKARVKQAVQAGKKNYKQPSKVKSSGEKHVRYRPSKYVAVPLPAKLATTSEKNGPVKTKCSGSRCYLLVDKNTSTKHLERFLESIVKNAAPHAKVHVAVERKGAYAVAKAVVVDQNKTDVSYATADQGIFAVTVEIPKSEVNSAKLIEGNVIFLQTDPVLRIYLRSENNQIAVAKFTIRKAVDLNTTDSIEFASCSIGVRNVKYDPNEGTISFQMSDGNQPVYIPSVKIVAPGTLVLPQYDSKTRTYVAKLNRTNNAKIEAYVDGCGEIIYPLVTSTQNTGTSSGGIAAILVIIGIVAAAIIVVARA